MDLLCATFTFILFLFIYRLYKEICASQERRRKDHTLRPYIQHASPKVQGPTNIIQVREQSHFDEIDESYITSNIHKMSALGFDCEWVSVKINGQYVRKPVSLMQLATESGECFLFHMSKLIHIPHFWRRILRDDNILKIGVNCCYDADLLLNDYGLEINGCLDLRHLYQQQIGLAALAKNVIGINLIKDVQLVCSNWDRDFLTNDEVLYAAKDAWAAIEIFKKWKFDNPREDIDKYIDKQYKVRKNANKELTVEYKTKTIKFKDHNPKFTRKSHLYDNCWMYANDGQILCSCDKKKAQWYVSSSLAEVICEHPFSIRLLFEPKGRPTADNGGDYYRQYKHNCCVVCGSEESYMRHYVVPKEYRIHFPVEMKTHQSHDIVLTCPPCHLKAKRYMNSLKEKLAKTCNAPTYISQSSKYKECMKIKNVCRTLLTTFDKIPLSRKNELEKSVKDFFGLKDLTQNILQEICTQEYVKPDTANHGKKIVEYFQQKHDLKYFEKLWREDFLVNLNPKFLPSAWSVDHNHKKTC